MLARVTLCLTIIAVPKIALTQTFGVPNSNKVLKGNLTAPDGDKIRFGTRDGTMVTVKNDDSAWHYGFQTALDPNSGVPLASFWNLRNNAARQVEKTASLGLGSIKRYSTAHGDFLLGIDSIYQGSFPKIKVVDPRSTAGPELQKLYGANGGGVCCVTCGATTTCATVVEAECGSCTAGGSSPI